MSIRARVHTADQADVIHDPGRVRQQLRNLRPALSVLAKPEGAAEQFFAGLIDDLAVYNRRLASGEIRQLYLLGRGGMYERRRRTLRRVAVEQAGFKAYWARRQNQIIGGGV